jgi:hypothetical protein
LGKEKYKDIKYSNLAVPVAVDCVDVVLLVELAVDVDLVEVTRVVVVALVVAVVVAVPGRHWPN